MFDVKTAQLMTLKAEERKVAMTTEECDLLLKKIEKQIQQVISMCSYRCSFDAVGISAEVLGVLIRKLNGLGYKTDKIESPTGRVTIWIDWNLELDGTKAIRTFGR